MQKRYGIPALCLEAILCLALFGWGAGSTRWLSAAAAFPLEPIGDLLRGMSLSGAVGNVFATVLYVCLSLLPCLWLAIRWRKGRLFWGDGLLAVLSADLFVALYLMVNPGLMSRWLGGAGALGGGKLLLGGVFYSLLVSYLVLRVLRRLTREAPGGLLRDLRILLWTVAAVLVFAAFGTGFGDLLSDMAQLRAANEGNEGLLGPSYLAFGLGYAVTVLTCGMDLWVVFSAMKLVERLRTDRYGEGAVNAANRLVSVCVKSLTITVLAEVFLTLFQLAAARYLHGIHTEVNLPIGSILLVLLVLLLARMLRNSADLRTENDLFI